MSEIDITGTDYLAIPGLKFRHFRGESDYPPMLAVLLSSEAADGIERSDTLESLANNYQHISHCDPYKDMIFAEVPGELVGYGRGWWSDDAVGGSSYDMVGFVAPSWRRRGIGSVMLSWMENRLRAIAVTQPSDGDKFFQVEATQQQEGKQRMLEKAGYQPMRYFFEMLRSDLDDIPEAALPAGLALRPVLAEHYPAIWASVDETSVDEWGYSPPTEEDYEEWLHSPNFQPDLWQVAWDEQNGKVVGHVLTYIDHEQNEHNNRKRGFTEGIGVHPAWRQHGMATALISHSLKAQKAAGMTESALVVDSENASGATRLYERCGFQVVGCNTIYRKPLLGNI